MNGIDMFDLAAVWQPDSLLMSHPEERECALRSVLDDRLDSDAADV